MPGGYAHLTLVNQMRELVDADDAIPVNVKRVTGLYLNYCELGAISPDYPYLDIADSDAASWADLMHYTRTTDMIRSGVKRLWPMTGARQQKCLAWLLGYAAHVVMDVTVHPIVELKVGPYAQNKTDHRICEMHQDAYIFQRMNLGQVGLSEHFDSKNNGILSCHHAEDEQRIDADIFGLWNGMLRDVHPGVHGQNPPDVDSWHAKFGPIVDAIEEGSALPAFARHVAVNAGLTYPSPADIDHPEYIDALTTPEGPMPYDAIFDRARDNVAQVWGKIGHDVGEKRIDRLADMGAWNLDTGRDGAGKLVFWND
ncbi:MAG: zinc dependent phospholipase C family protein [Rhodospirillales bacterium]|nr:zinc dependent phospholipase C family protein [Rhodospirillales bacterium]